ncbi:transposase [Paraliobacillus sp. X-1268]|uniref:transposase n=1 Tax=Paraliobacillus sp. X-1268 TaxID=2213193 RepID=UPI000E3CA430|nr:transposase [Paraliobacillus sp. X-1268]
MEKKKKFYTEEVKQEVIEMKLSKKYTNKQIMVKLVIRNKTQIKTWMRWYRQGAEHRLSKSIGKQYSFGKGPGELSEIEQLKRKVKHLEIKNDILKKYQEIERSWHQK